jgi:hypothetical protein
MTCAEVNHFLHNFLHGLHNFVERADDCLFSHASPILYLIHFGLLGLVQPSRKYLSKHARTMTSSGLSSFCPGALPLYILKYPRRARRTPTQSRAREKGLSE